MLLWLLSTSSPPLWVGPAHSSLPQAALLGEMRVTCLRPVESSAAVGNCDRAAQKAPEGDDRQTDTQTDTIHALYDDCSLTSCKYCSFSNYQYAHSLWPASSKYCSFSNYQYAHSLWPAFTHVSLSMLQCLWIHNDVMFVGIYWEVIVIFIIGLLHSCLNKTLPSLVNLSSPVMKVMRC